MANPYAALNEHQRSLVDREVLMRLGQHSEGSIFDSQADKALHEAYSAVTIAGAHDAPRLNVLRNFIEAQRMQLANPAALQKLEKAYQNETDDVVAIERQQSQGFSGPMASQILPLVRSETQVRADGEGYLHDVTMKLNQYEHGNVVHDGTNPNAGLPKQGEAAKVR